MWNKFKKNGREFFSTRMKEKYLEYSPDMLELLNEPDAKHDFNTYFHGVPSFINQQLPYEYKLLPEGIYRLEVGEYDPDKLYALKLDTRDECLEFKYIKEIKDDFIIWNNSKDIYKKIKSHHKRGVLLYGPPGTGKTSLIHHLITKLRPENSLVIFCPRFIDTAVIDALKPDMRLKIFVFEELTETLRFGDPGRILDFLDGESSLDNMFVVASTNYPEKLPTNLVDRPGRFDRLYKVGYLIKEDVKTYFKYFLGRDMEDSELDLFHKTTIAELKEVLLLVLRDKMELYEAVQRIHKQGQLVKEDFSDKDKVGFQRDEDSIL